MKLVNMDNNIGHKLYLYFCYHGDDGAADSPLVYRFHGDDYRFHGDHDPL